MGEPSASSSPPLAFPPPSGPHAPPGFARRRVGRFSAGDVPRPPRRVPPWAAWREVLLPFATGASWMVIGAVALLVGILEGLPPPERANRATGFAWLVGLGLTVTGGALVSWAIVRSTWWSRLQRRGRAADATVVRADPVTWLAISGRQPVDVELSYEDADGRNHTCRLRVRGPLARGRLAQGETVVLVHSPERPDDAALYWDG